MSRKDLVVLAADRDMEQALRGILSRPQAIGIRPVTFDIFAHPEHDGACARRGVSFLVNFLRTHDFGLLVFDHEGSGREGTDRRELQRALDAQFAGSGWARRARTIVVSPELEAWVWSPSPHVDDVMGWKGRRPGLREWLVEHGLLEKGQVKPRRPKEALHAALRRVGVARSASLYRMLAERVSLRTCVDPTFLSLRNTLQEWFPAGSADCATPAAGVR